MQPELHLGPLTLQTFGICFAVGFVAAGAILARRLKEVGHPPDWSYEIIFSGLVGGLIGSRIDYLIQNYDKVSQDLLGNLFSGSGLVWFGGMVGGALGVVIWAWRRGYLGLELLDVCAVPLTLGYAIGRVGCQLSGDGDYGTRTNAFWGMSYPHGTVPTTHDVHPTPVFESVSMGIIAVVLWRLRDRFATGQLFALYLILTGTERLLIEFLRRNDAVVAGLTLPQLVSIGLISGGVAMLARAGGLRPRSEPA
jgi:phosphatidylglycerol:prolipoprotein diacylglycerol transferase